MAPRVLNSTASCLRHSSKKREALKRSPRANFASRTIEPIMETSSALAWKSGSDVYIVSPGCTPEASRISCIGLLSYFVATTPLGGPVVPEVYIIPTPPTEVSSTSTSGSASA